MKKKWKKKSKEFKTTNCFSERIKKRTKKNELKRKKRDLKRKNGRIEKKQNWKENIKKERIEKKE